MIEDQDEDKMLSFAEVARRLGVSGHMVTDIVDSGEIAAFTPATGKHRRIWQSELARYRKSKFEKRELCESCNPPVVSSGD